MALIPTRRNTKRMVRTLALIAIGAIALTALLYGVVLNGFGLFTPLSDTGTQTQTAATADIPKGDAPKTAPLPTGIAEGTADSTADGDRAASGEQPEAPDEASAAADAAPDKTGESRTETTASPPPRTARNVTPPNVLSRPTTPYRDPRAATTREEAPEDSSPRRFHRIVVEDAATLRSGNTTIRFAGIAPIAADRTCTDAAGQAWPCGRVAAAALRRLIRHRAIDCTVAAVAAEGIVATCSAGLQDINGWLVAQGWAEVPPDSAYAEDAEAARGEKRGIYLAEWRNTAPGDNEAASLSAFSAPSVQSDPFSVLSQGTVEGAADQGTGLVDAIERDE